MAPRRPKIVVVGSSNMDLVVKAGRIPAVGETILGGDFMMVAGGKGANQAVGAARLGAHVFFIAKLGDDTFGRQSLNSLRKAGVDTKHVTLTGDVPSGVALIMVDDAANNVIVVAPGANSHLRPQDVKKAKSEIVASGAVVAQLEVPLETVEYAAAVAHGAAVPFILDPAPARKLPARLLKMVDVLKPNETEAGILTGVRVNDSSSAARAARKLLQTGVKTVILTMGAKGFLFADSTRMQFVPAIKVKAVDATAAGDAFTAALAFGISQGISLFETALFANHVAALSVTKMGAQPSMPTMREVKGFMKQSSQRTSEVRK